MYCAIEGGHMKPRTQKMCWASGRSRIKDDINLHNQHIHDVVACLDDSEEWWQRGLPFYVLLLAPWAPSVWIHPVPPFSLHHWRWNLSRLVQVQAEDKNFGGSTRRNSQGRSGWLFALNIERNKMFQHEEYHRPANVVHVGDYGKNSMIQGTGICIYIYTPTLE